MNRFRDMPDGRERVISGPLPCGRAERPFRERLRSKGVKARHLPSENSLPKAWEEDGQRHQTELKSFIGSRAPSFKPDCKWR